MTWLDSRPFSAAEYTFIFFGARHYLNISGLAPSSVLELSVNQQIFAPNSFGKEHVVGPIVIGNAECCCFPHSQIAVVFNIPQFNCALYYMVHLQDSFRMVYSACYSPLSFSIFIWWEGNPRRASTHAVGVVGLASIVAKQTCCCMLVNLAYSNFVGSWLTATDPYVTIDSNSYHL